MTGLRMTDEARRSQVDGDTDSVGLLVNEKENGSPGE